MWDWDSVYRTRKSLGERLLRELSTESCGTSALNGEIFYSLKEAQIVIEEMAVRVQHQATALQRSVTGRLPRPPGNPPYPPPGKVSQPLAVM